MLKGNITGIGILILMLISSLTFSSDKGSENKFILQSNSFRNNAVISAKFARNTIKGGKNISPQLTWKNFPKETKSFALICIDIHKVAHRWIHWMVINIPSEVTSLPENASLKKFPDAAVELNNSFGNKGWGGPQPPKGTGYHKYIFIIYALNVKEIASRPQTEKEFSKAIKGKILAHAMISCRFKQ